MVTTSAKRPRRADAPQPGELSELAAQLRLVITRTARRLRQEAGTNLGPSQTAALATIERHGPLTPSELADIERVQRPTATRIVARLEEEGLVDRVADPVDRRKPDDITETPVQRRPAGSIVEILRLAVNILGAGIGRRILRQQLLGAIGLLRGVLFFAVGERFLGQ